MALKQLWLNVLMPFLHKICGFKESNCWSFDMGGRGVGEGRGD